MEPVILTVNSKIADYLKDDDDDSDNNNSATDTDDSSDSDDSDDGDEIDDPESDSDKITADKATGKYHLPSQAGYYIKKKPLIRKKML